MFIDEKTNTKIHANLDESVIRGTHRNCDLIPAFLDVIESTAEYTQMLLHFPSVITDPTAGEWDDRWDDLTDYCVELMDVLELYAPEGYYFGCTEGDSSDFGYWKIEEL
jgi:hypothetical protein